MTHHITSPKDHQTLQNQQFKNAPETSRTSWIPTTHYITFAEDITITATKAAKAQ